MQVAGETRRIRAADVIYFKAERDFTHVVCSTGNYFVSEGLKSLLDRTAPFGFARVHKSFAVNLRRLDRLTRTEAGLGCERVPVGRSYWRAVADVLRPASAPATGPAKATLPSSVEVSS